MKPTVNTIQPQDDGKQIKQFLKENLKLSRREITRLMQGHGILLNNQAARLTEVLHSEDVLYVTYSGKDMGRKALENEELEILFEDEYLVAVNKPAGIPCHATAKHDGKDMGTLLKKKYGKTFTVRCIGRLDQGVSGVCLYAKDQKTAGLLSKDRNENVLSKIYAALAAGHFEKESARLITHMKKEKGIKGNQVAEEGQLCITNYRTVKEYNDFTLLDVMIETGRTHQIRSTFANLSHPLLGDRLYGGDHRLTRPALHCRKITFTHPYTGETVVIEAPLPNDFQSVMR